MLLESVIFDFGGAFAVGGRVVLQLSICDPDVSYF